MESSLQCIKALSEAIDMKENIYISKLFSDEIFKNICNLPKDTFDRVKITMLNLIGILITIYLYNIVLKFSI